MRLIEANLANATRCRGATVILFDRWNIISPLLSVNLYKALSLMRRVQPLLAHMQYRLLTFDLKPFFRQLLFQGDFLNFLFFLLFLESFSSNSLRCVCVFTHRLQCTIVFESKFSLSAVDTPCLVAFCIDNFESKLFSAESTDIITAAVVNEYLVQVA
jgi:hypothetical protein